MRLVLAPSRRRHGDVDLGKRYRRRSVVLRPWPATLMLARCSMRARRWPARLPSACCRMARRASVSAQRITGPGAHQVQLQAGPPAGAPCAPVLARTGQAPRPALALARRWVDPGGMRTSTRSMLWPRLTELARASCSMRARRWPVLLPAACCRLAASWCAVCSGPGQGRACALPWRRRDAGTAMWILKSGTDVDRQCCARGRRR